MALDSLPFPGSVTTSSAVSLKISSSACPGQVSWLFVPFQGASRMRFWWPIPSPSITPRNTPVSTDSLTLAWLPQPHLAADFACSSLCSPVVKSAKQAAQVGFAAHRLLDRLLQATLGSHSVSDQWGEFPGQNLHSILPTQNEKEKLLVWVIPRRDPGLCKLPSSHGSGITAYDESSLLTVHHKTVSEILCPGLCVWLFGLFGDLV